MITMRVIALFRSLLGKYGPQHWWPVIGNKRQAQFEIAIGAILTQNTNWNNVEKALSYLKKNRLLSPRAIVRSPSKKIEQCIKSSGYYRQKARKLKIFSRWLVTNYTGDLKRFFKRKKLLQLREELLQLWGVGKETADSILLYAGDKPIFVVDAYTKKFCAFKGVYFTDYDDYRLFFEKKFQKLSSAQKTRIFNEYHALIVKWGKQN